MTQEVLLQWFRNLFKGSFRSSIKHSSRYYEKPLSSSIHSRRNFSKSSRNFILNASTNSVRNFFMISSWNFLGILLYSSKNFIRDSLSSSFRDSGIHIGIHQEASPIILWGITVEVSWGISPGILQPLLQELLVGFLQEFIQGFLHEFLDLFSWNSWTIQGLFLEFLQKLIRGSCRNVA